MSCFVKIHRIPAAALLLTVILVLPTRVFAAEPLTFEKDILPIVQKNCIGCHSTEKHKGDLDLERFQTDAMTNEAAALWQRSSKRVANKEMPPKKADIEMAYDDRMLFVKWAEGLENKNEDCDQVASEETVNWYPGVVKGRRLSRSEYENTIRDLFGMKIPVAQLFPADGAGGEGFDNTGNALYISNIQAEKYLQAASLAVETALPRRGGSAEVLARLVTATPSRGGLSPRDAAKQVLTGFLERAWRAPAGDADIERMLKMFDRAQDDRKDYVESVKLAMKAALVSPNFLFLTEPQPEQAGTYALGDFQLASKLSYFIWASMPDEELFAAARAGQLQDSEQIRSQVKRMLLDPKSRALGEVFAEQWLGVTQLGVTTKPDPDRYTEFDSSMADTMREEVALYFSRIVAEDRSLLELLQSDYTYVNEKLAAIYGINDVHGDEMRLVTLNDPARGGVTGMAAVLTATSHPLRTSPVLRGKWVMEQLLGDHVPPPPPNVPQLPEDERHPDGLTLRERLEAHRANPECASCHASMDQIGFGLENFDPIGRWRTTQADQPIDAKGVLPSGDAFEGPTGLKELLLKRKDDFARNLARKMVGYALGRGVGRFEACVVDASMKALQADDYRISELITTIALSHPFRHRYSGGGSKGES